MKASFFVALLVVVAVQGIPLPSKDGYNMTDITVFYESLCPDSIGLITGSLNDAFTNVPELFYLQMFPYGNAETTKNPNGTYSFTCQHGPNECVGNQEEACVIFDFKVKEKYFPIIECMSAAKQPQNALDECSQGQNLTAVHECYDSGQGAELMRDSGVIQHQLPKQPNWIPWVLLNGVQTYSYGHLTRQLCSYQSPDNCPPGCQNASPPGCGPL
eukprot:CAMPEP_0201540330 /NCGR_PEP_ID=MMETSP0161_2-20130828/70885_1 /ASSEMBLY_ACC=CAM_ASM_000251 /TAXON_ID=180227 /ORGANISM="Neoparamoeba aestuarina, Strain SoJaBio B1-5/56/2" /LENGTH=214 /DNA_ID=CAMNT_0047947791 /DNA_START=47 /DNA_END=691 /DNA_ORIENTATION=+